MEMKFAWEHLNENGVLIVDNINNNQSFYDFCENIDKTPMLFCAPNQTYSNVTRFGLICK